MCSGRRSWWGIRRFRRSFDFLFLLKFADLQANCRSFGCTALRMTGVLALGRSAAGYEQWFYRLKGSGGIGDVGFVGVLRLRCASLRMTGVSAEGGFRGRGCGLFGHLLAQGFLWGSEEGVGDEAAYDGS